MYEKQTELPTEKMVFGESGQRTDNTQRLGSGLGLRLRLGFSFTKVEVSVTFGSLEAGILVYVNATVYVGRLRRP